MSKEIITPDRTVTLFGIKQKVVYRIELDGDDLARMAARAFQNKNGKAQDGPCIITILEGK